METLYYIVLVYLSFLLGRWWESKEPEIPDNIDYYVSEKIHFLSGLSLGYRGVVYTIRRGRKLHQRILGKTRLCATRDHAEVEAKKLMRVYDKESV